MINSILYKLFRSHQRGWDPIGEKQLKIYSSNTHLQNIDSAQLDNILTYLDNPENKKVLDLGAGTGRHTKFFSEIGCQVDWLDVSVNMLGLAKEYLGDEKKNISFHTKHIEEIDELPGHYDLIFIRLCWCYCFNDSSFSNKVISKLDNDGILYVLTNNSNYRYQEVKIHQKIQIFLNQYVNIKIGHPHPPEGRVRKLFTEKGMKVLHEKLDNDTEELILKF